jgi:hypothetical protein
MACVPSSVRQNTGFGNIDASVVFPSPPDDTKVMVIGRFVGLTN